MHCDSAAWRRLNPDTIADLPEAAGVFEIANLVRTIVYIGAAEGNLRARLRTLSVEQAKLPACAGGLFVRYQLTAKEAETLAADLTTYRAQHGGELPVGNREAPRPLRLASRSAA